MRYFCILAVFLSICAPLLPQGGVDPHPVEGIPPRTQAEVSPQSQPTRVVSLAPNITEVIFALGKGTVLVGRTDWCNYPPEAKSIPSVGSITDSSVEVILSLSPDLVLSSPITSPEFNALLEASGVSTIHFEAQESYGDTYQLIQDVGRLLNATREASRLVEKMKERTQKVLAENIALNRPRVYYVVGYGEGGDWTATGETFIHQLLTMAGGDNIAVDLSGWSISLERIVAGDPDIVVLPKGAGKLFSQTPIYRELRAVREGRVVEVDEDLILRLGPRLVDGLERLHSIFRDTTW